MRWTALNGIGALFWVVGLYMALSVSNGHSWGSWLPANALYIGGACGLIGLVTLIWANIGDA